MIYCSYGREAAHEKRIKLTSFYPFCNVKPTVNKDEDTVTYPPSYFDQGFSYTWIPHDIGFQAYRRILNYGS